MTTLAEADIGRISSACEDQLFPRAENETFAQDGNLNYKLEEVCHFVDEMYSQNWMVGKFAGHLYVRG